MTTYMAKAEEVSRKWYLVDATDLILGRMAAQVAFRLRGKHKPEYTPHCDTGDYVVIINADKVKVTAKKADDKIYHHHTGYIGGIKSQTFNEMQAKHPGRAVELAIKGMMPRGPLGRKMLGKLKVYAGDQHPHAAQQPEVLNFKEEK